MSSGGPNRPWVNGQVYNLNRRQFSFEDLAPYAGRHVAFNHEGTTILAQGADHLEVAAQLQAEGIGVADVVFERIPELWEDTWL